MEQQRIRTEHDAAVRMLALQLLCRGYEVKARIEGWFEQPDYIFDYRPDIVACKAGTYFIVEVKKGEGDWPKITALERFQREHQQFRVKIISSVQALAQP